MRYSWSEVTFKELLTKIGTINLSEYAQTIQIDNLKKTRLFLSSSLPKSIIKTYSQGDVIVNDGSIVTSDGFPKKLAYSAVPLGIILSGSVVVLKDGKGTKTLEPGDFIGLYETSDWLLTAHNRQIGEWTLYARSECEIAFFDSGSFTDESTRTRAFTDYLVSLSKHDHVPQPITSLPLLDWVASHTTRRRLADCAIIVHTHLLPNSAPFFRHLSHLVAPGNIFIMDKPYSTIPAVYKDLVTSGYDVTKVHLQSGIPYEYSVERSLELLWKKVIETQNTKGFMKLLIVDDGGDLWTSIPWSSLGGVTIAGVEQTQRGIERVQNSSAKFPPIVSVASAGIKKNIESQFIGTAVVKKLIEDGALANARSIGILGVGSIGSAVFTALQEKGLNAIRYDPQYHQDIKAEGNIASSIDVLLNTCDLIIGTVGKDAIIGSALERAHGSKVLASASSADVEFGSLLKLAQTSADPLGTQHVEVHEDLTLQILNGGYPINFDRIKDSTPDEDIVLTRCMLYIGAMQAAKLLEENHQQTGLYVLDIDSQRHMLNTWVDDKNNSGHPSPILKEEIEEILSKHTLVNGKTMQSVWI